MRLLAHPRFRAAYDFLLLRLTASSEHAEDVAFWRAAQTQSSEELSAALGVAPLRNAAAGEQQFGEGHAFEGHVEEGHAEEGHAGENSSAAPKRRRRRRRPGSVTPAAE